MNRYWTGELGRKSARGWRGTVLGSRPAHRVAGAGVAGLLLALQLTTLLLAASESWHREVHHVPAGSSHQCLVTLLSTGQVEHNSLFADALPLPILPRVEPCLHEVSWMSAPALVDPPERAPPF